MIALATPLAVWYEKNPSDVKDFEKQMRRKVHYVIEPLHLWSSIAEMARTQSDDLLRRRCKPDLSTLRMNHLQSTFQGLFF